MRNRRSIRLKGHCYTAPGAYFLTMCTHKREWLFGRVEQGRMKLHGPGRIALQCWYALPEHFPKLQLDEFVVMPNHIHGIVVIRDDPMVAANVIRRFGTAVPGSIPTVVRSLKSAITRGVNRTRNTIGAKVWQRGYWEHVVRDEAELRRIQSYIARNPEKWESDRLARKSGRVREEGPEYGLEDWMI